MRQVRHHGACPYGNEVQRPREHLLLPVSSNDCSPLLTWTPELCTVSGVAQFDTMSKPLIAFLAIVHGVRTQLLCKDWVEVDTITGTSGAGCSEPPD